MSEETTLELEGETDLEDSISYNSNEYDRLFPLPPHEDESLCRDEFLRRLFEDFEKDESMSARKTIQSDQASIKRRRLGTIGGLVNAEAMAIYRMLKMNRKSLEQQKLIEFKVILTAAEKQVIFKRFLAQFQRDAIEFLSVKLKKSLEVFVNIWPDTQIPYNLFHWSIEHFEARSRVNQLYLDVLTIERSDMDLNCAKFCTDVHEIIRLLDAIRSDIHSETDICNSSIALMKDSNYDQNAKWVLDLEKNREIRARLALDVLTQQNVRDKQLSESVRASESKVNDAYIPIELRYRINWVRTNGDQHLMWLQGKEKALQDELDELNNQMNADILTHETKDYVCQYQIDNYRNSIAKWEEQLGVDMEDIELKNSETRNLCAKAKDDLKMYMDQVEMFKQRVAQVLELEEDEERAQRSRGYRRSTKLRFGLPSKQKTKKKGNKKK